MDKIVNKKLEVIGDIGIEFMVTCPNCNRIYFMHDDKDWFESTMGVSFPLDGTLNTYDAKCLTCGCEFTINGFMV